jgi:hypothetical protein
MDLLIKYFLILFVIISCSTKPRVPLKMQSLSVDPTFLSILKELPFKTKLPISIKKLPGKMAGGCKRYKHKEGVNAIYINPKYWKTFTKNEKKLVLIHEIGHCDYGLKHDKSFRKDGCPKSIMYPEVFDEFCFLKYQKDYIEEINILYKKGK